MALINRKIMMWILSEISMVWKKIATSFRWEELIPEKGLQYLIEAFKNCKTDKKLVIAGGQNQTKTIIINC